MLHPELWDWGLIIAELSESGSSCLCLLAVITSPMNINSSIGISMQQDMVGVLASPSHHCDKIPDGSSLSEEKLRILSVISLHTHLGKSGGRIMWQRRSIDFHGWPGSWEKEIQVGAKARYGSQRCGPSDLQLSPPLPLTSSYHSKLHIKNPTRDRPDD